ncbi:CopG-like domain-containing protein DNA-binding [Candidatus Methylobacter favarea]|uniref:CopG-like domain-containing protein DNA-binding n=1 Tax=Candidatus Methylobacter favarea TaxID=2707345 RepID=A0A8S0Y6S9_9GAMM|nr:CopG family ribbon-helix-helix protein [Candidatus Methylobacter favarea]CAA9892089.1 CopG-like domain-containing protein DNA-binding [Candidatus Methylobacter favarea]
MSTTTITIRTDPDLAGKVAALASSMDRSRNWVIEEALRQYVETQAWQIEGIKAAIGSLDRGEGIPHEQVMAAMEGLLSAHDKRA